MSEPTPRILNHHQIGEAVQILREGGLVAFPTETVYGLAGNATNDRAIAEIFAVKGRPQFNPLIIHVPNVIVARQIAIFDGRADAIAARFWPGPLSLVLKRQKDCPISLLASAGLDSIALRVPAHELALDLLRRIGVPLAAPSANRSGRISPTKAAHVREELGSRIAAILDGGACEIGVESTVLDLSGPHPSILRPGGVTQDEIEEIIGELALPGSEPTIVPRSPGMLASHYAPNLKVRLNATSARRGEALLAFGPAEPPSGFAEVKSLSADGDLNEAAANLFSLLRSLDCAAFTGIAVMPIPERGLGIAINDRLRRAAAPRHSS